MPMRKQCKQYKQCKQTGRSMIEMLGVLAIIGVLSAGGIAGYSAAMESHKVNKFMEMFSYAAAQSQVVFSNNKITGKASHTFDKMCELNIMPDDICNAKVDGWSETAERKGYFGEKMHSNMIERIDTDVVMTSLDGDALHLSGMARYLGVQLRSKIPLGACVKILTNEGWRTMGKISAVWDGDAGYELPLAVSDAVEMCDVASEQLNVNAFFLLDSIEVE